MNTSVADIVNTLGTRIKKQKHLISSLRRKTLGLSTDLKRFGEERLNSVPLENPSPPEESDLQTIFDEEFYRRENPELPDSISPLEHYRTNGWKKGRNPHPFFDVSYYLATNPDVAQSGCEPLEHYLGGGWREHRNPHLFFDVRWYLEMCPYLVEADMEPLAHYINGGYMEGCSPSPHGDGQWYIEFHKQRALTDTSSRSDPTISEFSEDLNSLDVAKPNILVVTHDSCRSGAPIIALNLVTELKSKYNVIAVSLRAGALDPNFSEEGSAFFAHSDPSPFSIKEADKHLKFILEKCDIEFAILNSVESVGFLPSLSRHDIPTVHLIHEFASYVQPSRKIFTTGFYSDAIVYPASIVRDNAPDVYPPLKDCDTYVVPQGLCKIPKAFIERQELEKERGVIQKALRPAGWENAIVILGIGTLEYRKGADLFFMCAERIIKANPGKQIRFVWAGPGFKSDYNHQFCIFIADQLKRMGTGDATGLIDQISQADLAYELADVLFVSSRLDPFPLVAQEAMAAGCPVFCFGDAVGTAETLSKDPEAAKGVIPYLDLQAAISGIQSLIDDPESLKRQGRACHALAENIFKLDGYIDELERIALAKVAAKKTEIADRKIIRQSGLLDLQFTMARFFPEMWSAPYWWYCRAWTNQFMPRKPLPGFHPGVYAERNSITERDPFAHYIEAGCPDGPWKQKVIPLSTENLDPTKTGSVAKVALQLHLFHPDQATEICERLSKNKTEIDLFVTVTTEADIKLLEETFALENIRQLRFATVPNRGRDVGAFLNGFEQGYLDGYEFIGHLHTKRSNHVMVEGLVDAWREFLFENHLGGKAASMDQILTEMKNDQNLGLVFPEDPNVATWGDNFEHGLNLCELLRLPPLQYRHLNFPMGTYFWARTAALKKLLNHRFEWSDYPEEPCGIDGTILHAIERIIPVVASEAGYGIAVTTLKGVTR